MHDLVRVGDRRGDGFLDQDVLARARDGADHVDVQVIRRADDNSVDVRVRAHFVDRRIDL